MTTNPPKLEELDKLLAEGLEDAKAAEQLEGLDALDALLEVSMEDVRAREQYQADLKARQRNFHGMSAEEVAFCNSRMAAFEAARIWQLDDAVEVWALYSCTGCGSQRWAFSRLMEHQTSRVTATTHRWVSVTETKWTGPINPVKEVREVSKCGKCSEWALDPTAMTDIKELLG